MGPFLLMDRYKLMLREFLQNWTHRDDAPVSAQQSGAIPYQLVDGRPEFLLVTARRSGRWIFPKGSIGNDLTPWDSAAREAFEEAGVRGVVGSQAVGAFRNNDKGLVVDVELYPLLVIEQLDDWQEKNQRLRHWASLAETKRLVANRRVAAIVERLHNQLTAGADSR